MNIPNRKLSGTVSKSPARNIGSGPGAKSLSVQGKTKVTSSESPAKDGPCKLATYTGRRMGHGGKR